MQGSQTNFKYLLIYLSKWIQQETFKELQSVENGLVFKKIYEVLHLAIEVSLWAIIYLSLFFVDIPC